MGSLLPAVCKETVRAAAVQPADETRTAAQAGVGAASGLPVVRRLVRGIGRSEWLDACIGLKSTVEVRKRPFSLPHMRFQPVLFTLCHLLLLCLHVGCLHVGLEALNQEVTRQAAMIGYIDDFALMLLVVLGLLPLLMLIRTARRQPVGADD